jgi:hypothetical protein
MVFNNINISSLGITPLFYVLFILVVPYEVPLWLQLVFGFILGYSVDIFCDTPGLNSAASVVTAFLRIKVLDIIAPRDGYENGTHPYLMEMGFSWFLSYSVPLIVVHHAAYFMLDAFGFENFLRTLLKIIFTSICTEVFVIFAQYIAYRK